MKKYLFILIIIPSLCFAGPFSRNFRSGIINTCADSSCSGFDVCQNFETPTTGYDNSESWTESGGTVNPVDTTPPIGRGSQQGSVVYSGTTGTLYFNFTARSEFYIHFIFSTADATPAAVKSVLILNDGSTTQYKIVLGTSGLLGVTDGTSYAYVTDAISDNTDYHVWGHYVAGGGTNAVLSIEFTASSTRTPTGSGTKFISVSNGDSTSNVSRIVLVEDKANLSYYDQVLGRSTAIGTVCN